MLKILLLVTLTFMVLYLHGCSGDAEQERRVRLSAPKIQRKNRSLFPLSSPSDRPSNMTVRVDRKSSVEEKGIIINGTSLKPLAKPLKIEKNLPNLKNFTYEKAAPILSVVNHPQLGKLKINQENPPPESCPNVLCGEGWCKKDKDDSLGYFCSRLSPGGARVPCSCDTVYVAEPFKRRECFSIQCKGNDWCKIAGETVHGICKLKDGDGKDVMCRCD